MNYLNPQNQPNDLIEWLALMQHHGAPCTTPHDFTIPSPNIGTFYQYCPKGITLWQTKAYCLLNL